MIATGDSLRGSIWPASPAIATGPDLYAFLAEHKRLPHIGDPVAPWKYRGWLLPYVIGVHAGHPEITDRWGYYFRCRDALTTTGKLPAEPIPEIQFHAEYRANQQVAKDVEKWVDILDRKYGGWSSFRELVDWLAWSLAISAEAPRLAEDINEELYRAVNLGPMLQYPSDYLGQYKVEHKARGKDPTGFFPTPHTICELMVQMTMADAPAGVDARALSVCDPCVGTGRMLLHASNHSLNLWGMDINPEVVMITKINGALYAPWMTWPLPLREAPPPGPLPDTQPDSWPVFRVDSQARWPFRKAQNRAWKQYTTWSGVWKGERITFTTMVRSGAAGEFVELTLQEWMRPDHLAALKDLAQYHDKRPVKVCCADA